MRTPMSVPTFSNPPPNAATLASQKRAPTPQMLRQMMASAAAAASLEIAREPSFVTPTVPEPTRPRPTPPVRIPQPRRHSMNQLKTLIPGDAQTAPLPPTEGGQRLKRINEVVGQLKKNYHHPANAAQEETEVLHQIRAILYMNRAFVTQSFISHVSGVSQGSLSHYVRGLFKGNQPNVDDRLCKFVDQFCSGELDSYLEEIRNGSRPAARPLFLPPTKPGTVPVVYSPASRPPIAPTLEKTPIPPPPPPQLQPAPWVRPLHVVSDSPGKQLTSGHPTPLLAGSKPTAEGNEAMHTPTKPSSQNGAEEVAERVSKEVAGKLDKQQDVNLTPGKPNPTLAGSYVNGNTPVSAFPSPGLERAHRTRRRRRRSQPSVSKVMMPPPPVFPKFPAEMEKLTPIVAVDRAFHSIYRPQWTADASDAEPLLVPIEIFVDMGGRVLHTYTQWDVNERNLTPEQAANELRQVYALPQDFVIPVAMQIRRALFDAGVLCQPPPATGPQENRRLIRFSVELKDGDSSRVLRDECEWDLAAGALNSPEMFAQQLCLDANIAQRHVPAVAQVIRKKLCIAHAISYGDEATRRAALNMVAHNDPLRRPLHAVRSALERTSPEDQRVRERLENEGSVMKTVLAPLLDDVSAAVQRRAEDRKRKEAVEKGRREADELEEHKQMMLAERKAKLEMGLKEAGEDALRVYEERHIDFRPYLAMEVARGERPSVWMPPAIERRRKKQLTFPMVQHSKASPTERSKRNILLNKRKRSVPKRDFGSNDAGEAKVRAGSAEAVEETGIEDAKMKESGEDEFSIPLKLRIKPPAKDRERAERRKAKRRRRR